MTGFLSTDSRNPLSVLSIALLDDLGYGVDYHAADVFDGIAEDCDCRGRKRNRRSLEQEKTPEREHAIQWGKQDLASRRRRGRSSDDDPEVEYVGDQLVFVLYQEANGKIAGVAVTP